MNQNKTKIGLTPIEQSVRMEYQEASNDLIDAAELQEKCSELRSQLTELENQRRRLIDKAYYRLQRLNLQTTDKWKDMKEGMDKK